MTDLDEYCRAIEAYLCRKNDGHLIRITGPAFEHVQGWATQGVPLKVAEAGIDRYFERYYRKGPRRRPVRVEFCDADVLDAFDDWRRAVGVTRIVADGDGGPEVEEPTPAARPRRSLSTHLDSVISHLTVLRGSTTAGPQLGPALDAAVRALDQLRADAARARGDARDALLQRVAQVDRELLDASLAALTDSVRAEIEREADGELAPFLGRMAPDAIAASRRAAIDRLVREHFGLPQL